MNRKINKFNKSEGSNKVKASLMVLFYYRVNQNTTRECEQNKKSNYSSIFVYLNVLGIKRPFFYVDIHTCAWVADYPSYIDSMAAH